MVEIYISGCSRLMRLLRTGKAEMGKVAAFVNGIFDELIRELQKEWEDV